MNVILGTHARGPAIGYNAMGKIAPTREKWVTRKDENLTWTRFVVSYTTRSCDTYYCIYHRVLESFFTSDLLWSDYALSSLLFEEDIAEIPTYFNSGWYNSIDPIIKLFRNIELAGGDLKTNVDFVSCDVWVSDSVFDKGEEVATVYWYGEPIFNTYKYNYTTGWT